MLTVHVYESTRWANGDAPMYTIPTSLENLVQVLTGIRAGLYTVGIDADLTFGLYGASPELSWNDKTGARWFTTSY